MKLASHVLEILAAFVLLPVAWFLRLTGASLHGALVVGWWGSETVGDVAILGQFLAECGEVAPQARVTVASFRPAVTAETLRELQREDVALLPIGVRSGWAAVTSRCLVFSGGPLMESNSMPFWALRAWGARLAGGRVLLYACGIGPVRRQSTHLAISTLLRGATHVVLRDETPSRSFEALRRRKGAVVSFDPAYHYVAALPRPDSPRCPLQLALVLRFPSRPYLAQGEEAAAAERLLTAVAAAINRLSEEKAELRLVGLVMHTGYGESDDHRVYARLRERLDRPDRLQVAPGRHTVTHVANCLASSTAALTVRFHGMVFAVATGTPFVAIDYSSPRGKVQAAAELAGVGNAVMAWESLEGSALLLALRRLLEQPDLTPPPHLTAALQRRIAALARACAG